MKYYINTILWAGFDIGSTSTFNRVEEYIYFFNSLLNLMELMQFYVSLFVDGFPNSIRGFCDSLLYSPYECSDHFPISFLMNHTVVIKRLLCSTDSIFNIWQIHLLYMYSYLTFLSAFQELPDEILSTDVSVLLVREAVWTNILSKR